MNIFKKISFANKGLKIYNKIVAFNGLSDIREGIDLIKQGFDKICVAVPEAKKLIEEIKKEL